MALLAMCAWDTEENQRTKYTNACLESLSKNVDWKRHQLICVDNASVEATKQVLLNWSRKIPGMKLITNKQNIGQAKATNQAWLNRGKNEHCARIDNDIIIDVKDWLDVLEDCVNRDPTIGIVGGKRSDIPDSPNQPEGCWSRTSLKMLPHEKGQSWLVVEPKFHILGACQLTNSKLLDKVGYLYQGGLTWSMEDCLMATRCELAGFYSCYCPQVTVKHIDPMDDTPYQRWKNETATDNFKWMDQMNADYHSGKRSIYHGPFDE